MADRYPPRTPPVKTGDRVKQYEILGELGRGGMGIVFRARDTNLGREVALKCPWPEVAAQPKFVQRFLREARIASRISHTNVVPLLEVFEARDLPWLAMQLVEGPSLQTVILQRGALSPGQVARFAEELGEALEAAHAKDILHRDISPKNVLVDNSGRALLNDFGLARFTTYARIGSRESTISAPTSEGVVLGTPQYMSPEQALGKTVDLRSDIYSLGAVIYEMCTGKAPFGEFPRDDLLDAVLHREPRPISALSYEIPAELERIVRKCLAKAPEERYQGTQDFLVDIRALRRELEYREYSDTHDIEGGSRRRRRSWFLPAAVSAAAVAGILVLIWVLVLSRKEGAVPPGSTSPVTSTEEWEGEPAISPDGSRIAYVSNRAGNFDIYVVDTGGGSPLRLTKDEAKDWKPAWFPDGSAIVFVSDRNGRSGIWKIGQLGGGATLLIENGGDPSVSPDGKQIAFSRASSSGNTRIAVAPIADPNRTRILTGDDDGLWHHTDPAWSPDGRSIAYATQENLWIVPSAGGRARLLTRDGELDFHPCWSTDGKGVYFDSYRDGTTGLWRVSVKSGEVRRVTPGTGPESYPSLSGDGMTLAYSTQFTDHDIIIRDMPSGRETAIAQLRDDMMPTLAPDKTKVVFGSDRWGGTFDLWVQDIRDGMPVGEARRLTEHEGEESHPRFSPDGKWIAYYRILRGQRDIWVIPAEGGSPIQFTDDPAPDLHPAWSPDGRWLAFASERTGTASKIWVAPIAAGRAAGEARQVTFGDSTDFAPAFSPDGREIAFVRFHGETAEAWVLEVDPPSGEHQVTWGAEVRRLRWDGRGDGLLVSGSWGEEHVSIRRVSPSGDRDRPPENVLRLGDLTPYGGFDISSDDQLLVFTRGKLRGDIWTLKADSRPY